MTQLSFDAWRGSAEREVGGPSRAPAKTIVVGVDENGLGPRLGPLVATSVAIEVEAYRGEKLIAIARALGIDDSKATSGFRKLRLVESLSLALAKRSTGETSSSADEFLEAILLGGRSSLRARCPSERSAAQCFESALSLPFAGGSLEEGEALLLRLEEEASLRILRAVSSAACPKILNDALLEGQNKLHVDLELFERLLLSMREALAQGFTAYCGMIGGIRDVPKFSRLIGAPRFTTLEREKGLLVYQVEDRFRLRFEVGADAAHLPVALASMLGKYTRELLNHRMLAFYRLRDPRLPLASGYHDRVTTTFIEGAAPIRDAEGVDPACFLRAR